MIASGCDDSGLCAVCDISRDDIPRSEAKSARKSRALCANSQTLFRALTRKSYEILRGRAIQKAAIRSKYHKQSWKYDVYFLSPHQLEKEGSVIRYILNIKDGSIARLIRREICAVLETRLAFFNKSASFKKRNRERERERERE